MSSPTRTRSSATSSDMEEEEEDDAWYLALEPSHRYLSKDVGYIKQVQMKLQKAPHVLDVQGIRRLTHLYGSTAMFASQAKSNAHHWGNYTKTHKVALDQAHDLIEKEGYTHSRTRSAAKTVYAPAHVLEAQGFQANIGGPISDKKAFQLLQTHPQPFHSKGLPFRLRLNWDITDTLHNTNNESHTATPTPSRAQELFTTPHQANKMAPPNKKKHTRSKK